MTSPSPLSQGGLQKGFPTALPPAAAKPVLSPTNQLMLSFIKTSTPTADALPDSRKPEAAQQIDTLIEQLQDYLTTNRIPAKVTRHGQGLVLKLKGKGAYARLQPLMLTAHMDVVPASVAAAFQPVKPRYALENGKVYMATDGTTTLGADDKAGLAIILETVRQVQSQTDAPPLEVVLTPDEEGTGESLHKMGINRLKSRYAVVVDEFTPMKITNGLASNVSITLTLKGLRGGHSGFNITDASRLNVNILTAQLVLALGSGPVAMDPAHPGEALISKNIGVINGGSAENAIPRESSIRVLLRSHDAAAQQKELGRMQQVVRQLENQVKQTDPGFSIDWQASEDYPLWQGKPDSAIVGLAQKAAVTDRLGTPQMGRFHATTQGAVLANMKNRQGELLEPIIIGPEVQNAHSVEERVELNSVDKTQQWLTGIINQYATASLQPQIKS